VTKHEHADELRDLTERALLLLHHVSILHVPISIPSCAHEPFVLTVGYLKSHFQ
jgi:hypothetical protein